MNKLNEISSPNLNQDEENDQLNYIIAKVLEIIRRSWFWILLIIGICVAGAFVFLRYTKPLYQASSELKLDISQNKDILGVYGLGSGSDDNLKELRGELEFIGSENVTQVVIDKLNLAISYFAQGNFIDYELYPSSPFLADIKIKSPLIFDQNLFLEILDANRFRLNYQHNGQELSQTYNFGQEIDNHVFKLKVDLDQPYEPSLKSNPYYFRVNSKRSLIKYIRENLKRGIKNPDARIISLSFSDHNRFKARDIVAAIDTAYMEKSVEYKNQSNIQKLAYINEEINKNEDSLIFYESRIQNFFLENKTKDIDQKLNQSLIELEKLIAEKQQLSKKIVILIEISDLINEGKNPEEFLASADILGDTKIEESIRQMIALQENQEQLSLSRKPGKTIRYRQSSLKLEAAQKKALTFVKGKRKALRESLRDVEAKIYEIKSSFTDLPIKGREYNRITRQYKTYDQFYTNLLNRRTELQITKAGIVPQFTILSPAYIPDDPIYPEKLMVYLIAVACGLFLSAALVGTRFLLHNTISSQVELERLVQAPVLGSIPKYKKEAVSRLVVNNNPKSSINEAFRSIRTNLDFIVPTGKGIYNNTNCTVLTVTSTVSGEGKTFVSANLGGIIAVSDLKVVVLDSDMRKPRIHEAFGGNNFNGLSSILIGRKRIEDCIQKTEISNLDFIASGPIPPNPSELILREDFDLLLDKLKNDYDVIVIDTPPVGLVTDAILIMQKVDVSIYVTRANYSKKFFIKSIKKILNNNSLSKLALIINSVSKHNAYGGYGYGYGVYGGDSSYYANDPQVQGNYTKSNSISKKLRRFIKK